MSDIVLPRRKTRIRETGKDRVFNAINLVFWIIVLFIVLYPLWLIIISSVSDPDAVRRAEVLIWPVDFSLMGYEAVFQHSELWNSYLEHAVDGHHGANLEHRTQDNHVEGLGVLHLD